MASDGSFLFGKVALVTGATRGIGLSIAKVLIASGCRVLCCGRDATLLHQITGDLGDSAYPLPLDVAQTDSCKNFMRHIPRELKLIRILVNNAGHDVGGRRLFYQGQSEEWDAIIETNVKGLMRITHAVLPGMLQKNEGHIVNIGSVAGIYSYRSGAAYNASKFAVHGFSEALRKDLDHTNLRVTEIMPGLVKTDFARNRNRGDQQAAEKFYSSFPVQLSAEDVARAVFYALVQPPHVNVSQLMIEPVQAKHYA